MTNGRPKNKQSIDNIRYWIEYGIDMETRTIMLDDEIDEYSTGWAVRAVHKMIQDNPNGFITLYINTYGGSCYDGLSLYDTLKPYSEQIVTVAQGKLMSMGLILFLVGRTRLISPHCAIMAHSISSGTEGKLFEQITDLEETKRVNEKLLDILSQETNKNKIWWKRALKYEDKYFTIEEAIDLGIGTGIYL